MDPYQGLARISVRGENIQQKITRQKLLKFFLINLYKLAQKLRKSFKNFLYFKYNLRKIFEL